MKANREMEEMEEMELQIEEMENNNRDNSDLKVLMGYLILNLTFNGNSNWSRDLHPLLCGLGHSEGRSRP